MITGNMKKIITNILLAGSFTTIPFTSDAQSWTWAKSAGGTAIDAGNYLATDASGNTYVIGSFNSSTASFGSIIVNSAGSDDVFLAKYDATGNPLWVQTFGSSGSDIGHGVAIDGNGFVYISGSFSSATITLGSFTIARTYTTGFFLAKLAASGNVIWAAPVDGQQGGVTSSVTVDNSGNVIITGCFASPDITFGSIVLGNTSGTSIFIAKYDGSGNSIWATGAGCTTQNSLTYSNKLVCDTGGNIFVTGSYGFPSITFGTYTLMNNDPVSIDMFAVKCDASGNVIWAKSGNGVGDNSGANVVVDPSGNIFVTGYFYTTNTFGSFSITSAGGSDLFLVKYDALGNELWVRNFGGNLGDYGIGLCNDYYGNILLTGYFKTDTLWLGSIGLPNDSAGGFDCFIAKMDANGNAMWALSAGGKRDDRLLGVTALPNGDIYSAGMFKSSLMNAGPFILNNTSTGFLNDMMVVKIADLPTGITLNSYSSLLTACPVPSSGIITVSYEMENNAIAEFTVLDLLGNLVVAQNIALKKGKNAFTMDLNSLKPDVYFLRMLCENNISTKRIIISR